MIAAVTTLQLSLSPLPRVQTYLSRCNNGCITALALGRVGLRTPGGRLGAGASWCALREYTDLRNGQRGRRHSAVWGACWLLWGLADTQTARENESLVSIGRKFGLQHPAPLLELNSPIYPEIETCYQKLRNTHTLKVVLLCVVSSPTCIYFCTPGVIVTTYIISVCD